MSEPIDIVDTFDEFRLRIRWEDGTGTLDIEQINPDGPNAPLINQQSFGSIRELSSALANAVGRDTARAILDEHNVPANHPVRTLGTDRTEANPGSTLDKPDDLETPSQPQ